MLEKLFAANKGISKLTGKRAESMEEMMMNQELMKMVNSEVNEEGTEMYDDDNDGEDEDEDDRNGGKMPLIIDAEQV